MLRRRALLKKATMDWDYEWSASDGVPPVDKNGNSALGEWKTDGEDWQIGLWAFEAYSHFEFAESAPILVEMVVSVGKINVTYPQVCFCYAKKCGFKLMYTPTAIQSTITGSSTTVDTTHLPQNLARITVKVSDDECHLTFNDVKQSGPGVVNSTLCPLTRISIADGQLFLKELRYKYL